MKDRELKLIIGSLLHDIGKVVYRKGDDKRNHSIGGCDWLKENNFVTDKEVLECVRYHHASEIRGASIDDDSLAYITYMADNISASADRRKTDDGDVGFDIHTPLQPVFNILNGNNKKMYYQPGILDYENNINYPIEEKKTMSEEVYSKIISNIMVNLRAVDWSEDYINSLMEVLEANLSFIPSSTSQNELCDVSLFDHLKLTAAFAICIERYLESKDINNYKESMFINAEKFYDEQAFLLASIDISGIQSFIYTITTSNALKTLRARSFYLEVLMEHMVDSVLEKMGLSRVNVIYVGGGHTYMILPNTKEAKEEFDEAIAEINEWLLNEFDNDLFAAGGYVDACANDFKNEPQGSYQGLFRKLSDILSQRKAQRYDYKQIMYLNSKGCDAYDRECKVCRRTGNVNEKGRCKFCQSIEDLSSVVLRATAFSVVKDDGHGGIKLPGGYLLRGESENSLKETMKSNENFKRAYGKNKLYTGKYVASKIWVGDYVSEECETFNDFAEQAKGIDRIGVLRADVDNLGQAIVEGFKRENDNRFSTISRTATFSRQLSLFFKLYINDILSKPESFVYRNGDRTENGVGRKCAIVYSGGDDLFIVGAWNDVIGAAIDLKNKLRDYSEDTLKISAGIGVYDHSYPISVIAEEVAAAESRSKENEGNSKNSITLFENQTYKWDVFEKEVLNQKLKVLEGFFDNPVIKEKEYGKSYLYKMFQLISEHSEKINYARYVYLLARMEPDEKKEKEISDIYKDFSQKMLKWFTSDNDREQLETAIMIYVYLNREKEGIRSDN